MNLDLHLLERVPVMILRHFENATTMTSIILKTALIMIETTAAVTASATTDRAEASNNPFSMTHVLTPLTDISFLIVLAKELSMSVAHVFEPVPYVEAVIIKEAFSIASLSHVIDPLSLIFVASRLLSISRYEYSKSFSLLPTIDATFVEVAILIMPLDGVRRG